MLDLWSDDEDNHEDWFEPARLAALTPIRSQLLQGDLRATYVAWPPRTSADGGEFEQVIDERANGGIPAGHIRVR